MYYCLRAWISGSPWRMIAHKKVWEINRERRGSQGLFWHKVWSGGRTQQLVIKYLLVDSSSHLERKKGQGYSYRSRDRTWGKVGVHWESKHWMQICWQDVSCISLAPGKKRETIWVYEIMARENKMGESKKKNSECCFAIPLTDVSRARMRFHRWPDSFSAKKCG